MTNFTPPNTLPKARSTGYDVFGPRIGKEKSVIPPGIEHRFPGRPTRKNGRTRTTFRLPLLPFLPVHVPHQECCISRPSIDANSGTMSPNLRRHAVTRSSGEAILIRITAAASRKEWASLYRTEGSASNPGLPF
jgi:hypothetical protein